jgi:hypothetical protein
VGDDDFGPKKCRMISILSAEGGMCMKLSAILPQEPPKVMVEVWRWGWRRVQNADSRYGA